LNISNNIARLNTGVITSYALYILIGLIIYLLFNSYINNSIIILALCISLSLVLLQSRISITPIGTSLQSSTELQGLLAKLSNYVKDVPTGSEMREKVGDDIFKVSDLVAEQTKVVTSLKRDVCRLADSELSQPTVTPALTNQINNIKQQAADLAVRGGSDLAEGMQAVTD
jgi:hypothetical protein